MILRSVFIAAQHIGDLIQPFFHSARELVRESGQLGEVRHGKLGLLASVLAHQLPSARKK